MDSTIEERKKRALDFFKEKFNINLQEYSPQQTKIAIEEINKCLDEVLEKENEKNKKLNIEILIKNNEIAELTQELNNQN